MATFAAKKKEPALAEIKGDCVYPVALFERLTGLNGWARRKAQQRGLKVSKIGNRKFVPGSDFLAFLDRIGNEPK